MHTYGKRQSGSSCSPSWRFLQVCIAKPVEKRFPYVCIAERFLYVCIAKPPEQDGSDQGVDPADDGHTAVIGVRVRSGVLGNLRWIQICHAPSAKF